ncbi:MAG TPA: response regulator [Burkholderiaceae bacterium]|nr:response regulator [Burkholderiaceae bacterium]
MPHHGSILAVDDTEASLQILSDLLKEAGHSVRTALSGKLALLSAAHRVPDLILLDIRMPDMDGFEVCRQLKARADTRDVPVIFISALSDTDEKIRSFQLGAVDYVTKPFQRDELLARVSTHIHLRRMQLQVHTQNEELRQYRAQLEDLVAQRTAELQNSNQRLKLMSYALDQVREAAYLIGKDGAFFYVNQEACRAHGYSAEELQQLNVMDIDPDISAEAIAATWHVVWEKTTGPVTFEARHRRRDGSIFPVEVHSSPIRFENHDLALALAYDITERKEAERRLRDSYAQLQELNSLRESDREDERKRIAHELHDELGQCLTALRIGISTLRYREERDSAWLDGRLVALTAQVDDTIRVVRSVTVALRPPVLGMGIGPALEWLVAQFQKTTDLSCEVHIPSDFCGLTEAASVALYRIVQEALTNVARHSQARTVRIFGQHNGGGCQLNIVDDGSGIHAWALDGPSLGLLGMRERAQQLGGTVVVDAAPGRGTRVSVWIPSQHADT